MTTFSIEISPWMLLLCFVLGGILVLAGVWSGAFWVFRTKRESWEPVLPGKQGAEVFNMGEEDQWNRGLSGAEAQEIADNEMRRPTAGSGMPVPSIVEQQAARAREALAKRMEQSVFKPTVSRKVTNFTDEDLAEGRPVRITDQGAKLRAQGEAFQAEEISQITKLPPEKGGPS